MAEESGNGTGADDDGRSEGETSGSGRPPSDSRDDRRAPTEDATDAATDGGGEVSVGTDAEEDGDDAEDGENDVSGGEGGVDIKKNGADEDEITDDERDTADGETDEGGAETDDDSHTASKDETSATGRLEEIDHAGYEPDEEAFQPDVDTELQEEGANVGDRSQVESKPDLGASTDTDAGGEITALQEVDYDETDNAGSESGSGMATAESVETTAWNGDEDVADEPEGPPDDEEMPLAEHIEEMVGRLAVVAIAVAVATAVVFPLSEFFLLTIWSGLVQSGTDPHIYEPLEKILAQIKVASLAGVLVALPVFVYETYLFMRPGLYPKERRYYLAAVPTSLVLGGLGMLFSYFLVLPILFRYFITYSEDGVDRLAFGLSVTFDLIVTLLGAFAVVFQIPLLVMLAIMMGITDRRWLEQRRIYFWGGFLGAGFLIGGVDLTGMAPIIIAATMIGLFEGTLALLRYTQEGWRSLPGVGRLVN
jgi:sec-independent protein translocase protein TatC